MSIFEILDSQPSAMELIIKKLIDSGMSYRDLADKLEVSHTTVANIYQSAKDKLDGGIV